jgi:colanic acid/amylovoran biosynthesis glycosyltransferase
MQVCFKVNSFPEISETFVLNSIISAVHAGHEVRIITDEIKSLDNSSQKNIFEAYSILDKTSSFNQPTSKKLRYKEFFNLLIHPTRIYYYLKLCLYRKKVTLDYVFYLKFYASLRDVDVFHVHFATALEPLLYLKKTGFLKANIVVTFHGYDAHFMPRGKVLKQLTEDYSTYINVVTVNSQYLKTKLVAQGFKEKMIYVVPIGVDTSFFNGKRTNEDKTEVLRLISVGRLIPLKGQRYGIETVKKLVDKGLQLSYTIIGDGPEYDALSDLIHKLNLNGIVKLLGQKSQMDIKEAFSCHDVFIMPSTIDKNGRREAFGLVSIEAQAMGLPVIGFQSGGFPETVQHSVTGFILKDKDVAALSKKIVLFYNNRTVLNEMSINAMSNAKHNFDLLGDKCSYLKYYK